jgi:hypothetical protein
MVFELSAAVNDKSFVQQNSNTLYVSNRINCINKILCFDTENDHTMQQNYHCLITTPKLRPQ